MPQGHGHEFGGAEREASARIEPEQSGRVETQPHSSPTRTCTEPSQRAVSRIAATSNGASRLEAPGDTVKLDDVVTMQGAVVRASPGDLFTHLHPSTSLGWAWWSFRCYTAPSRAEERR